MTDIETLIDLAARIRQLEQTSQTMATILAALTLEHSTPAFDPPTLAISKAVIDAATDSTVEFNQDPETGTVTLTVTHRRN